MPPFVRQHIYILNLFILNYLTPCINFFNTGFNNITNKPATTGTIVKIRKKVESE